MSKKGFFTKKRKIPFVLFMKKEEKGTVFLGCGRMELLKGRTPFMFSLDSFSERAFGNV